MGAEAIQYCRVLLVPAAAGRSVSTSWLDDAIDTAQKFGIQVILCTPYGNPPPAWLSEEFPDSSGQHPWAAQPSRCAPAPLL